MTRSMAPALAGMLMLAGVAGAAVAPAHESTPRRPCVAIAGPDSLMDGPKFVRATTPEEWAAVWDAHSSAGKPDLRAADRLRPEVDFSRFMVIAFFRGESWNGDGERVESIDENDERVRIRFDKMSYQTFGPGGGGVRVRTYGIWVIDRTSKPIVLEENVQGLKNEPATWKERHRFAALP